MVWLVVSVNSVAMRGSLFVGMILILCFVGCDYGSVLFVFGMVVLVLLLVGVFVFGLLLMLCWRVDCLVVDVVYGFVFGFWILRWVLVAWSW